MASKQQREAADHYAQILAEVSARLNAIHKGTSGTFNLVLPSAIIREFCFLQLRMICELIALGCLFAHGDIVTSKRVRKEWSAEKIMDELERLHPYFFPLATKRTPNGDGTQHIEPADDPMTKVRLLRIYGRAANFLHRGTANKFVAETTSPTSVDFGEVNRLATELGSLMSEHLLAMRDGSTFFFAVLRSMANKGMPEVAIAERPSGIAPPPAEALTPKPVESSDSHEREQQESVDAPAELRDQD